MIDSKLDLVSLQYNAEYEAGRGVIRNKVLRLPELLLYLKVKLLLTTKFFPCSDYR